MADMLRAEDFSQILTERDLQKRFVHNLRSAHGRRNRSRLAKALVAGLSTDHQEKCAQFLQNKDLEPEIVAQQLCLHGLSSPEARETSIQILISLKNHALEPVAKALGESDERTVSAAKEVLIGIGTVAIDPVVKSLKYELRRKAAIEILIALANSDLRKVCSSLLEHLKTKQLRMPILHTFMAIGERAMPEISQWESTDKFDRSSFCVLLEKLLKEDRSAKKFLQPKLQLRAFEEKDRYAHLTDKVAIVAPLAVNSTNGSFSPINPSTNSDRLHEQKPRVSTGKDSPAWKKPDSLKFSTDSRAPFSAFYTHDIVRIIPPWKPSMRRQYVYHRPV